MKKTSLPTPEGTIRTFIPPDPGFDPLKAGDKQLLLHGFPQRPDQDQKPELHKAWQRMFGRKLNHIVPVFSAAPQKKSSKPEPVPQPLKKPSGALPELTMYPNSSWNWAGAAIYKEDDAVRWIVGQWTVPNPCLPPPSLVAQAAEQSDHWEYISSMFLGIGGWGVNDGFFLADLQAGTHQDLYSVNPGEETKEWFAYWRTFQNQPLQITNLPVHAGDTMSCMMCIYKKDILDSPLVVGIHMVNLNTGDSVAFSVEYSDGTFFGNSGEWILARGGEWDGGMTALPYIGNVYFDEAWAGMQSGEQLLASDGTEISMQAPLRFIANGRIIGERLVRCDNNLQDDTP